MQFRIYTKSSPNLALILSYIDSIDTKLDKKVLATQLMQLGSLVTTGNLAKAHDFYDYVLSDYTKSMKWVEKTKETKLVARVTFYIADDSLESYDLDALDCNESDCVSRLLLNAYLFIDNRNKRDQNTDRAISTHNEKLVILEGIRNAIERLASNGIVLDSTSNLNIKNGEMPVNENSNDERENLLDLSLLDPTALL